HVMARESFEDPGIADILNTSFIAIKVDREERPDIDSVYMTACQLMTGQGGWPLTIIMTPDRKPFFAGTYLPRHTRAGMKGLSELLQEVARLWQVQRDALVTGADQLIARLAEILVVPDDGTADQSLLQKGYEELAQSFDSVNGGFGRIPRFPIPTHILFLLRFWKRTGSALSLRMAEETLEGLRCGGIHDHLGGGFHRYSTDAEWRVPHFEKMLYDQALLVMAFTEAWQATKKPLYKKTAEDIIAYVTRDLLSPEGAFISAEDADSPDGEGAFYLWTRKELDDLLGFEDSTFAANLFNVRKKGNFFSAEAGTGKNILFKKKGEGDHQHDESRIESIRQTLLAGRAKRPRPRRDEKILSDWNGLMIAALAQSSRAFDNPDYYRSGETAMRFILDHLRLPDGSLWHRYCDGEAAVVAFADDYACCIWALIELYETSFDPAWLAEALVLDRYQKQHFADTRENGYFTTSDNGETLIVRKKEIYDGAVPSANSVTLGNLVLLGHLTGNPSYEEQAARLADAFSGIIRRSPSSFSFFLCSLDHLLGPASDVVISGEQSDPETTRMIHMIRQTFLPSLTVHVRSSAASLALDALAPFTKFLNAQNRKATAYLCAGQACRSPVTTAEALMELLKEKV
ncbi:MAG TPA: thioredoxin domain-containing protein, partial [Methanoregula sp.]|nr:thioredoxin domain-containing protein [Methanoregula sp.]